VINQHGHLPREEMIGSLLFTAERHRDRQTERIHSVYHYV